MTLLLFLAFFTLLVIGAINWGSIGLFQFNIIDSLLGTMINISMIMYIAIGISGIIAPILLACLLF